MMGACAICAVAVGEVVPGSEDSRMVTETMGGVGNVLNRWIATWGENGEGSCCAEGRVET
jgi:hypothetical protein